MQQWSAGLFDETDAHIKQFVLSSGQVHEVKHIAIVAFGPVGVTKRMYDAGFAAVKLVTRRQFGAWFTPGVDVCDIRELFAEELSRNNLVSLGDGKHLAIEIRLDLRLLGI